MCDINGTALPFIRKESSRNFVDWSIRSIFTAVVILCGSCYYLWASVYQFLVVENF